MATYKKPDGTHTSSPPPPPPETSFPRALGESAQQIWLAGLGALGRAQEEGGRLFETLVREGREVDNTAREHLDAHTSSLRDGVESTVDGAREQVTAGWERVERLFDSGLQRTLTRLGVPTRRDVAELNARVEALTAELRKRDAAARRAKASATAGTPMALRARRAPGAAVPRRRGLQGRRPRRVARRPPPSPRAPLPRRRPPRERVAEAPHPAPGLRRQRRCRRRRRARTLALEARPSAPRGAGQQRL
ncbi:phasin family protein [Luteimonas yindakuii]|uniref:phasin family protein n=1 Tax=Luteimonas yindakuii TaxID=2565782 RepID=UPI0014224619|nr:phasin family protein [Luteimonas yindakuii]